MRSRFPSRSKRHRRGVPLDAIAEDVCCRKRDRPETFRIIPTFGRNPIATVKQTIAYHILRILWFFGGLALSYMMCLGVAIGAGIAGPFGGFTRHEKLSMNSLMLFSGIAALLGVLALGGTHFRWIRTTGRLLLLIGAPVLLAIHLNYSWASSGPVHRLDPSHVTGLVLTWALAIALWEMTCCLGCRQATRRLAGQSRHPA